MYEYKARWIEVLDGDTVRAELDLGLDTYHRLTLRLAGINAPEMGTPEGEASKKALIERLANSAVLVRTIKDQREKYGRFLGILEVGGLNVNQWLMDNGFAKAYP